MRAQNAKDCSGSMYPYKQRVQIVNNYTTTKS